MWQAEVAKWSVPSDGGYCKHISSGKSFEVDDQHPYPYKDKKGKVQAWSVVANTAPLLPVKEGWVPLKTWVQTNCHKTKKCGDTIGNWESSLNDFDSRVKGKD